jgi:hypothetical protein
VQSSSDQVHKIPNPYQTPNCTSKESWGPHPKPDCTSGAVWCGPGPNPCKVHIRIVRANRHCATTFGRLGLLPPHHLHSTSTLIILICVRVRPPYCTCIAPFVSCGSSLMYLSPGSCARNGTSLSPLILAALSYLSDTSAQTLSRYCTRPNYNYVLRTVSTSPSSCLASYLSFSLFRLHPPLGSTLSYLHLTLHPNPDQTAASLAESRGA